jgi:hypothetical protein
MPRLAASVAVLVLATASTAAPPDPPTTRLHHYYGTAAGYAEVTRDVLAWHKTRQNGCVAFASTALRRIGVAIPMDVKIDGRNVSRITRAFSRYLVETLNWQRIERLDDLRAGDILFSTDAPCCRGYPNHVAMFDGWLNRGKAIARVVDNQGFEIARPLIQAPDSDVDGFAYALRAPPT